jgi:hypothetical protein
MFSLLKIFQLILYPILFLLNFIKADPNQTFYMTATAEIAQWETTLQNLPFKEGGRIPAFFFAHGCT